MSSTAQDVAMAAEWFPLAGVAPSAWVPLLGLLLGLALFFLWQKRSSSVWGGPADVADVPTYRSTQTRMSLELARMRRYERSLAVMVLHLEAKPAASVEEKRNHRQGTFVYWHVGAMLRSLLRDSDIVTSDPSAERFVIVLPESNRNQALLAAHRLQTPIVASAQMRVRTGVAEFPGDGLILEELVKVAEAECSKPAQSEAENMAQVES